MSSHVVVIATDLRRTTVKVSPGTYLIDVLQEACKKLSLSSDKYLLKNKQKTVDLSVPFRTSGLTPGAKLELVQKANTPSVVQVGLQVPLPEGKEIPGGRLIHKFPSDLSLWHVLRQFESGKASAGKNVNITARGVAQTSSGAASGSGQMYYEIPVLNIMGRELGSFADFQKTLSQLGYNSGSVLIRLSYKRTDQTLFDAMEEIGRFFNDNDQGQSAALAAIASQGSSKKEEEEAKQSTKDEGKALEPSPTPPQERSLPTTEKAQNLQRPISSASADAMDIDPSASSNLYEPVNVFLAPSASAPAATLLPANEYDYTPSVAHAQLHQARLEKESRNKRLLSDRELEAKAAAEEAKIASVKSVLVKVRFPDNTSSDWKVGPAETGAFLYEAIRHVMHDPSQPFHLVLPGEKTVIKNDTSSKHSLIKGYKLAGRVLVNLVWDDAVSAEVRGNPFLKATVAQRGKQVKVQDIPQGSKDNTGVRVPVAKKSDTNEGEGGGKKVPKWFKLGKK